MPESTEQILHPEKYAADEEPVEVQLPADLATDLGTGWTVPLQDTFGEFQTGIWLREGGVPQAAADAAAAGWGGDRLAVIDGPDGAWAVAMHTAWDTEADAAEFETAATTALQKAGGVAQVVPGTGGTTRWVVDRLGRRDASRRSPASSVWRAGRPPALHRLGRGDPEQPERVRERDLRRARQREPRRRALRLGRVDDPRVAVEGVERRRQLGRVGGDALRLLGRDRVLDDLGNRATARASAASGAPPSAPATAAAGVEPGLGRLAQDRGDPGVGVLDVVDRVLVRLLLGELDVEVDAGRRRA